MSLAHQRGDAVAVAIDVRSASGRKMLKCGEASRCKTCSKTGHNSRTGKGASFMIQTRWNTELGAIGTTASATARHTVYMLTVYILDIQPMGAHGAGLARR